MIQIFQGRCIPDLYQVYGLARVAGWDLYNLHGLGHVSCVGYVLYGSCTASHNGWLGSR